MVECYDVFVDWASDLGILLESFLEGVQFKARVGATCRQSTRTIRIRRFERNGEIIMKVCGRLARLVDPRVEIGVR